MSLANDGSNYLPANKQSHLYIEYHRGLRKVLQRIRAKYPDLLMQACASGGGRISYGILPYFDEFWTSDDTDAVSYTHLRRPGKITLHLDDENIQPIADGSDLITVIASVTDENGNIKRLNNYHIKFSVEGEARLVANEETPVSYTHLNHFYLRSSNLSIMSKYPIEQTWDMFQPFNTCAATIRISKTQTINYVNRCV